LAKRGYWVTISHEKTKDGGRYRLNCRKTGGAGYETKFVDAIDYEVAQSLDPLERALEKFADDDDNGKPIK
jgi:hypothetical protein